LLLHEPTQGVDIGARQEIFRFIREATERGTAILYVSSEHEDLAHLCHRVLVLREGRVAVELTGTAVETARITQACLASASAQAEA
jgi:ribose transport system ATP-binding protein